VGGIFKQYSKRTWQKRGGTEFHQGNRNREQWKAVPTFWPMPFKWHKKNITVGDHHGGKIKDFQTLVPGLDRRKCETKNGLCKNEMCRKILTNHPSLLSREEMRPQPEWPSHMSIIFVKP